jgi:TonB family protein
MPLALKDANTPIRDLTVKLVRLPIFLQPVTIESKKVNYTGRLAGYYQRLEKKAGGYFITRDQIDRENPRSLQQLLQHVPAVSGSRMRGGGAGVRMRGRNCAPLVWLDSTPMPAGEVDLNAISPQTVQGIELYLGSTTAPARFTLNRDASSCGTIVIWSRGPDTEPTRTNHKAAQDLEKLVASLTVFTSDQVDPTARPAAPLTVAYPAALFAEGLPGSVVAEFVVDTLGRVEPGTFGIVSSSHALFSTAVREAVESAVFIPARKGALKVRQLVQQPFSFVPPRNGSNR